MTVRPTRIAQTTTEAKKQFKKNGQRLKDSELRRLQRSVDLETRVVRIREQEERRRAAKKKREEKERKDQEARRQLGVGLATQIIGYSHTQAQLKSGMEAFLGLKGRKAHDTDDLQVEVNNKLDVIAQIVDAKTLEKTAAGDPGKGAMTPSKEPWDAVEGDPFDLDDMPGLETGGEDSMLDDDLDDITLLEAYELSVPKAVAVPPKPAERPIPQANVSHHLDFTRVHGPVNKTLEKLLEQLPEPLIELLSIDVSTNQPAWAPPPSLLYKLNPVGLPPHRLRIKVGCTVCLLGSSGADNSNLNLHSHLRILKAEKESLECIYLDGPSKGTETTLTRIPFLANYKNDNQFSFQRLQFPVRVSTELAPPSQRMSAARASSSRQDPVFKVPGLPASNSVKVPAKTASEPIDLISLDGWDDFLDSGTQIARELSPEVEVKKMTTKALTARRPLSVAAVSAPSRTYPQPIAQKAPPPRGVPTLPHLAAATLHRKSKTPTASNGVFNELGLSTQEVISFFDDDD